MANPIYLQVYTGAVHEVHDHIAHRQILHEVDCVIVWWLREGTTCVKLLNESLFKTSLYLMIWGLGNFDVQRTREDGVPAGANVSLPVHWDRTALFSGLTYRDRYHQWTSALPSACGLTCDAFLQTLVESTQADLVQQTGMEALEGFHVLQTWEDYVDVLSSALCWSGQ